VRYRTYICDPQKSILDVLRRRVLLERDDRNLLSPLFIVVRFMPDLISWSLLLFRLRRSLRVKIVFSGASSSRMWSAERAAKRRLARYGVVLASAEVLSRYRRRWLNYDGRRCTGC
jgi:hypothetical protein